MKKGDKPKRKRGRPKGSKNKPKTAEQLIKKEKDMAKRAEELLRDEVSQVAEQKDSEAEDKKQFSVKVVATISKLNDGMQNKTHFKMMKKEAPPLSPCENLVCRIIYEEAGISVGSTFNRIRTFVETFIEKTEVILKN